MWYIKTNSHTPRIRSSSSNRNYITENMVKARLVNSTYLLYSLPPYFLCFCYIFKVNLFYRLWAKKSVSTRHLKFFVCDCVDMNEASLYIIYLKNQRIYFSSNFSEFLKKESIHISISNTWAYLRLLSIFLKYLKSINLSSNKIKCHKNSFLITKLMTLSTSEITTQFKLSA